MPLHLSKVAVSCAAVETLIRRQARRESGGTVPVHTRFRPKRAEELVGGSLYWIVKHRLAARQRIVGFTVAKDRRTIIQLDPLVVPVRPIVMRAHQGWRYLEPDNAPIDDDGGEEMGDALPPMLAVRLAELSLI